MDDQVGGLRAELKSDMNVRFAEVNARIGDLKDDMDARFGHMDARFTEAQKRMDRVGARTERDIADVRNGVRDLRKELLHAIRSLRGAA